jgi:2-polyprenyl-6-methoxyphenol hydroxylase-like FAD-dependent oxidoreductase
MPRSNEDARRSHFNGAKNMKPKTLIIGAGIGGLTSAIALRRAKFDVEVFERAPDLKEVGAGIALSPNAMRVLKHLGLMQQVGERGTAIKAAVGYTWRGREISRLATNLMDVPSVCLHRADLQQALVSALPPNCVHLGEQFVAFRQSAGNVTAHFASGRTATGDALIGADGLRSKVRAQLLNDGEPVYRGYQCWRGVCSLQTGDVLTETFGRGVRMGVVPLGQRGTAWWCCANEAECVTDEPEGTKSKLMHWIAKWHRPIPDILSATDPKEIIKTGIYDRRPKRRWSEGRATLLGDAAHPTTPNMGQGGCMAIEDAVVLARSMAEHSDVTTAFRSYERLRYARTARVTNISRYYGVAGQWSNPVAVWLRSALLHLGSGKAAAKNYAKFVGYDPYESL